MTTLHIYMRTRNGRTESMFGAPAGSKVVFHNTDCNESLQVLVRRVGAKHGRSSRKPRRIGVAAGKKRAFRISRLARADTMFKYSARIGRSRIEDPIIYVPGRTK